MKRFRTRASFGLILCLGLLWSGFMLALPTARAAPAPAPLADPPWNTNILVSDPAPAPDNVSRNQPALAASQKSSDVFAVWEDTRNGDSDIYFAHSTNDGAAWTPATRVNQELNGTAQSEPDIAFNPGGRLHVVWVDQQNASPAIYYAQSTNRGLTWSPEIRINDITTATAAHPTIAVLTSTVCIAWSDYRNGSKPDIYADCSNDNGLTWGMDRRVNDDPAGTFSHDNPDIAIEDPQHIHLVWNDDRDDNPDIYYAYFNGRNWSSNVRLNHDASRIAAQESPAIAVDDGAVYVIWKDSRSGTQVYANYSTDSGLSWQPGDRKVSDGGTVSDEPVLAVTGQGTVWAAWHVLSGAQSILYVDQGGSSWGTDTIAQSGTDNKQHPALTAGNTRQYLAWSDTTAVHLTYHDSATWASPVPINDAGEARQIAPALALSSNGALYAAWIDYRDDIAQGGLYAARSTNNGLTWSTDTPINDTGIAVNQRPALAAGGPLTVHVTWRNSIGSNEMIYYDRSADGGQTWGTNRLIAQRTYDEAGAGSPDIAADNNNNVYLAWSTSIPNRTGKLFLARSPNGGTTWFSGTEIITANLLSREVGAPALAVASDGTLHLVWQEDGAAAPLESDVCYARSLNKGQTWINRQCIGKPVTTTQQRTPDIAIDPVSGRLHVVWQDNRTGAPGIYYAASNDDGLNWSAPINLNSRNSPATDPAVAGVDNGVVYVTWTDRRNGEEDIYFTRSTDGGLTWSAQSRVNDDNSTQPQRTPVIAANYAASPNSLFIAWTDFRQGHWDIEATSLITNCAVPLTQLGISGTTAISPDTSINLTLLMTPANATAPLAYNWQPLPASGQGTATAGYRWAEPGRYAIEATAANCGGAFEAHHTVTVLCTLPLLGVDLNAPPTVTAGQPVTLTTALNPANANPTVTYQWLPAPLQGQGTAQAQYRWNLPGTYTVTVSATNCGGMVKDTVTLSVTDTQPPLWSGFTQTGWITGTQSPTITLQVQDGESGLDIATAEYALSTNGGSSWGAWQPAAISGADGTTATQTVTATAAFGQDSLTTHRNRIRFRIRDRGNNLGASPIYTVEIDTLPPTNPTLVSSTHLTNTWSADPTVVFTWTGAADASSGLAGYSYAWNVFSIQPPDAVINTTINTVTLALPGDGTVRYLHLLTRDNAGHWTGQALHLGPYRADTTPPPTPTIRYSAPVTGEWTSDNTIMVGWIVDSEVGSGVNAWSYEWSTASDTVPDTTPDPFEIWSEMHVTTSPPLPNNNHHFFHLRSRDAVGNWSETAHYGPFLVDNTPALLLASHGSGAPGSEVMLTGLAYQSSVTVTLIFTTANSGSVRLGEVRTSQEGTFQTLVTVPEDATQGLHGFEAYYWTKTGRAPFNVTPGMGVSLNPGTVRMGATGTRPLTVTLNNLNPNASVVLETDANVWGGPFPLNGTTTLIKKLQIPHNTVSGTHRLTATARINGMAVQRMVLPFTVTQLQMIPPITQSYVAPNINHGQRGTWLAVHGHNSWIELENWEWGNEGDPDNPPTICPPDYDSTAFPDGECPELVGYYLTFRWPTGMAPTNNFTDYRDYYEADEEFFMDSAGNFNASFKIPDYWRDSRNPNHPWFISADVPWGTMDLCLMARVKGINPFGHVVLEQGSGDIHYIPEIRYDDLEITCTPFTIDRPATPFTARYILKNSANGQEIPLNKNPQLRVSGTYVGYLENRLPDIEATFLPSGADKVIPVTMTEGLYTYRAFACNYIPSTDLPMSGRGNQDNGAITTVMLTPTTQSGPAVVRVIPGIETYLYGQDVQKIGPFLSLQGIPGAPSTLVPFTVTFPGSAIATVTNVRGDIGGIPAQNVREIRPNEIWVLEWDVNQLPAGKLILNAQGYGRYEGSGECGTGMSWGPPTQKTVVVADAPPWLHNSTWVPNHALSFTPAKGEYFLSGQFDQVGQSSSEDLGYLGTIENTLTGTVQITQTFNIRNGSWTARAFVSGGAALMCRNGASDCRRGYFIDMTALPQNHGIVSDSADPAFPDNYLGAPQRVASYSFEPIEVYNGVLATYWGIVTVNLSINFGGGAALDITPCLARDATPNIILTPSATMNSTISLWVDILMGVASAGVDATPSLTLGMPIYIRPPEPTLGSPQICFRLDGRVWVQALLWEKSFGPFHLMEAGSCSKDGARTLAAETPPPSTLPAPALTTDGYGHALGTWIHDNSNHPNQNQGVVYSVYFDGAQWGNQTPVAGDAGLLVTDPAVAFAGEGKAVAVFASNTPNSTEPMTWTQVTQQLTGQKLSYSLWNGTTWTAAQTLVSGGGAHGRVTIAGDPYHNRAIAMWIHDVTGSSDIKKWQVEYAVYDAVADQWSVPAPVTTTPTGSVDAEVRLSFDSAGRATAVWVRQAGVESDTKGLESPFNKNDLRRLVIATWNPAAPTTWSVSTQPAGLPTGALMPDIAFDDRDRPVLAYVLYQHDGNGTTDTGLGNNNRLGYAIGTATKDGAQAISWNAHIAGDIKGLERPRVLILPEDQATVVYRGFGTPGTPEYNGVAMATTIDLRDGKNAAGSAGAVTAGNSWMHDAVVLRPYRNVGRDQATLLTLGVYNLGGAAPAPRMSGASLQNIGSTNDAVLATYVPVLPDLAIAGDDFTIQETLPLSGTLVPFTVTVRNLGLARSHQPVTVRIIQDPGTPEEREIISDTVPAGLVFNGTYPLVGTWQAVAGLHALEARVDPPLDDDVDGANNSTLRIIGAPPAPTGLAGSIDHSVAGARLSWQPVGGPAMRRYHIYRAEGAGRLKSLGYTENFWFDDAQIVPNATYRYAVRAVTDADIESPLSTEIELQGSFTVYLPVVLRNIR